VSETLAQLPEPDLIVASIGAALISGNPLRGSALLAGHPRIRRRNRGGGSMYQSRKRERCRTAGDHLHRRDSGARRPGKTQFEIVSKYVADLVTVSDNAAIRALIAVLQEEKLLTNRRHPARSRALLEGKIPVKKVRKSSSCYAGRTWPTRKFTKWEFAAATSPPRRADERATRSIEQIFHRQGREGRIKGEAPILKVTPESLIRQAWRPHVKFVSSRFFLASWR